MNIRRSSILIEDFHLWYLYKRKTSKSKMIKNILKRREESDSYLTNLCFSAWNLVRMKVFNLLFLREPPWDNLLNNFYNFYHSPFDKIDRNYIDPFHPITIMWNYLYITKNVSSHTFLYWYWQIKYPSVLRHEI